MVIDLNKNVSDFDEIMFVNKYVGNVFKQFFKLKGFKSESNSSVKGDINFFYDYRRPAFSFHGSKVVPTGKPLQFLPMRYCNYPNIDDDFSGVTWAPDQDWMLGFVESLIISLNNNLLKIIDEQGEEFNRLVEDARNKAAHDMKNPIKPDEWAAKIEQIKENNHKKNMKPSVLSFDRSSAKEIKEDVIKLISSK